MGEKIHNRDAAVGGCSHNGDAVSSLEVCLHNFVVFAISMEKKNYFD